MPSLAGEPPPTAQSADAPWSGTRIRRRFRPGSGHSSLSSKALAPDLAAHRIRSNTIAPTFIETPPTRPCFEDAGSNATVLAKIKLGRVGRVEDLMRARST